MALGWGINGIGSIANRAIAPHVQELADSELVAVVSRDRGRADDFAREHGARHAYTRYEDMLENPEVQVVAVTTPNALHAEQAIAAARAGKHVLCDKPLAGSASDAERVVEECRKAGVWLGINFQTRHFACFREARRIIEAGELGELIVVQVEVSPGVSPLRSWRADRSLAILGTINNVGVHAYDLLRYLLDAEVREVVAMTEVGRRPELETTALSLFRFSNGTLAYVNANQSTPHQQPDIDMYGSKGRLTGRRITRPWMEGEMSVLTESGERTAPQSSHDGYRRVIEDFNRAVIDNREPHASGVDGLRSVQLTEAMARSAREGRVVELG